MSMNKHIQFATLVLATGLLFTGCQKEDFSSAKVNNVSAEGDYDLGLRQGINMDSDLDAHFIFTNEDDPTLRGGGSVLTDTNTSGSSSDNISSRPGNGGGDDTGHGIGDSEDLGENGNSKNKNKPKTSGIGQ